MMRVLLNTVLWASVLLTSSHVFAGDDIIRSKVASLPTSGPSGMSRIVTDGISESDCGSGGGKFTVLCVFDGVSSWAPAGTGGGGGGATSVTSASTFGTDNQLLRSDGTGRGAQASGVTLDDSNNMTIPGNLVVNGNISTAGAGPTVLEMTEGTAPGAPATAGHHNLYIDSADSRLKSHENGGSVVTYATPASTDTLTNKSYDTEGTGNVFTYKKYKYIPMAGCNNATAGTVWDLPTSNAAVPACRTGTNTQKGTLDFADGSSLSAQYHDMLTEDWTGVIDAVVVWQSSTTTGDVVWQLGIACAGDGESDDPAFTDDVFTADTTKGTGNQYNMTASNTITTTGTCAASKMMHARLKRDSAHASDTMAGTARAVGLYLKLREAQ